MNGTLPTLFVAHGAPPLLDDASWMAELAAWARSLPRPKSILMLSAHWEERPVTIGATTTVPLVYDFFGFPRRYYEATYASPGAPELASQVRSLLSDRPLADEPDRGLDHGAWVPLLAMYPEADVPVLQVSLPSNDPRELFAMGQALRPLRDDGVLIVGSGFITHNLRTIHWGPEAPPPPAWASEFDGWTAETLVRRDVDGMLDYQKKGPGASIALPTREHFSPLLVNLGAADEGESTSFPIDGFWMGTLTRRSVQFGGKEE